MPITRKQAQKGRQAAWPGRANGSRMRSLWSTIGRPGFYVDKMNARRTAAIHSLTESGRGCSLSAADQALPMTALRRAGWSSPECAHTTKKHAVGRWKCPACLGLLNQRSVAGTRFRLVQPPTLMSFKGDFPARRLIVGACVGSASKAPSSANLAV